MWPIIVTAIVGTVVGTMVSRLIDKKFPASSPQLPSPVPQPVMMVPPGPVVVGDFVLVRPDKPFSNFTPANGDKVTPVRMQVEDLPGPSNGVPVIEASYADPRFPVGASPNPGRDKFGGIVSVLRSDVLMKTI